MDQRIIEEAMFSTRDLAKKSGGIPGWGEYKELVKEHLKDPFNARFKLPDEYNYAYLRVSGLSDDEARAKMGLTGQEKNRQRRNGSLVEVLVTN